MTPTWQVWSQDLSLHRRMASTKWLRLVDTRSRDRPQSTIARKTLEVKLGLVVAGTPESTVGGSENLIVA